MRVLEKELRGLREMGYPALAARVGSLQVYSRIGPDGTEYQIEVEVFPDSPRYPYGNVRVIASIDDGTFPSSIKPVSRDFLMSPGGEFIGE